MAAAWEVVSAVVALAGAVVASVAAVAASAAAVRQVVGESIMDEYRNPWRY
ncbi:hypothetical protein D3C81_2337140 [compost metagenome]